MPNLFRHLCPKEKILTFVRMTFIVMPNLSRWLSEFIGMTFIVMLNSFQHLYHMEKIPTCVGMTSIVMLNSFQHLYHMEKILTFVRMTSIVMPNLFRHLCHMVKVPTCVGMTGFVVRTRLIASLREPLNNLKLRKLKTKYN